MDWPRKRQIALRALMLFCAMMSGSHCRDVSANPPYSYDDLRTLIPLSVGATWTYREISHGLLADTTVATKSIVGRHDTLAGTYYDIRDSENVRRTDTSFYNIVAISTETVSAGAYTEYVGGGFGFPLVLLTTPVAAGNEWPVDGRDSLAGYVTILNADTTITIYSGIFQHAIHVIATNPIYIEKQDYFIVPGIGIIRESGKNLSGDYSRELLGTNF